MICIINKNKGRWFYVNNWLLTLGVLILLALIIAGVNIVGVLLFLALVLSIGNAVIETMDERKKKKKEL